MTGNQAGIDFHLEEFKSLREEIQKRVQDQMAVLRYSMLGSAGVYTFLFGILSVQITEEANLTHVDPRFEDIINMMWLIPVAFSVFGAIRWWDSDGTIMTIAAYISKYEERIDPEHKGWETHIAAIRAKEKKIDRMAYAIWPLFISLTVIAAMWWWSISGSILAGLLTMIFLAFSVWVSLSARGRALIDRVRTAFKVERPQ